MQGELAEQVALVTGASRGIGRAIAVRLAANGARVYVNFVRDAAAGADTVKQIRAAGGVAEVVQFDVADAAAASSAIQDMVKSTGALHVLVNNAGMAIDNLVLRLKPEEWDAVMAVNLRGTFNCTRAAARTMIRAHYGRIINLSSVIAQMGNAGQAAYAAAKAGIIGFTKAAAREMASRNITVNAVAPGYIETELTGVLTETVRQAILENIPLGRLGHPQDVANLVCFLASDAAAYITGQTLTVDGGMVMH
jgi:3-oxoacyl-[acyl-carrier protein] reductase